MAFLLMIRVYIITSKAGCKYNHLTNKEIKNTSPDIILFSVSYLHYHVLKKYIS